ncbi:homoserine dehydrogenase [Streptococcus pluranimalium]|uniref:homoserine dehydrogenase n=1 Tax=Streptococcus pluranimalium TaxID=82348 RepID=UPI0039FD8A03
MVVKIGLLGFGTVAKGLPFLLKENQPKIRQLAGLDIEIGKVLVRSQEKADALRSQGHDYDFVTSMDAILADETIKIVVELMGRIEPAKSYISQALKAGKHVVSANKDLIACHGQELIQLAQQHQVMFAYEAAVAGGIPILRTLSESLMADKVTRILGVLNGTSNYMLTKMVEENWTYEKALASAQALGYAESDPKNDVEGIDAAYKLAILSQFGFGMTIRIDQIHHQGITVIRPEDVAIAKELGYVIKLIGDLQETQSGIWAEVVPSLVPIKHPLAGVNDVMNAVLVESVGVGQSMYYGPGAGQNPTATSVLADLMHISRNLLEGQAVKPFNAYQRPCRLAKAEEILSAYYVSVVVLDASAQLAQLADLFEAHNACFDQVLEGQSDQETLLITVITKAITRQQMAKIQSAIDDSNAFALTNIFKVLGESDEN